MAHIKSISNEASGYLYAGLAAVLWSFIGPLSKGALAAGVDPLETAFWRAVLGTVCFAAHTMVFSSLRIRLRDAAIFFLFGAWGVGILFAALQISIQLSGAAMAMVLLYTAPAWVAIASLLFFHEAVSLHKVIAICVALAGAAMVCFSGGSLPKEYSTLGILCGLLSGLAYASHFPFYTWWKKTYSTGVIYTYMLFGGAVFLLPFTPFSAEKSWEAWGNLLALGILTNYAAYAALGKSLQRISQLQSAIVGNIEPILATFWVWLFYGENFTAQGWIGCVLVIGAVFLLTIERKPSSLPKPRSKTTG